MKSFLKILNNLIKTCLAVLILPILFLLLPFSKKSFRKVPRQKLKYYFYKPTKNIPIQGHGV